MHIHGHFILKFADVLPTNLLDKFRKEHQSKVERLKDLFEGMKFDYMQCLQLTTSKLIRSFELPAFNELNEIHLSLHDDLDGCGGHSIFNSFDSPLS